MRTRTSRRQHAFTLIELLCVIAIIAIIVMLLLPAVQKVRESAARLKCQNNLHNVSLALHNCHDATGYFPQAIESFDRAHPHFYWSWMAQILPYVEQESLYRAADAYGRSQPYPWSGSGNPALGQFLQVWTCPSDSRQLVATWVNGSSSLLYVAFTGMLGVNGTAKGRNDGVICNARVTLVTIPDGASNTLMVGERPPSRSLRFGWWFAGAGYYDPLTTPTQDGTGDVTLGTADVNYPTALARYSFNGASSVATNCLATKYEFQPGRLSDDCDQAHFWSLHATGANFAFADGSVRFLTHASAPLMPALGTRAGGEAVGD